MDEPIEAQVLSLVEHEIVAPVRRIPRFHEQRAVPFVPAMVRTPSLAMPNYVEHREGATEIGKLTAEAIVREYETAAKEIEGMGAHLIDCVKRCETMTRDAFLVIEEMKETATRYREEAKRVFLQIEDCTLLTAEVRKTCTELKEKISVPRL
jgi:hypothetical protein